MEGLLVFFLSAYCGGIKSKNDYSFSLEAENMPSGTVIAEPSTKKEEK